LNRADCCSDRLRGARVFISNKPVYVKDDAANILCGSALIDSTPGWKKFDCNHNNGRYLYVTLLGKRSALTICGIKLFGIGANETPSGSDNALSPPTSATPPDPEWKPNLESTRKHWMDSSNTTCELSSSSDGVHYNCTCSSLAAVGLSILDGIIDEEWTIEPLTGDLNTVEDETRKFNRTLNSVLIKAAARMELRPLSRLISSACSRAMHAMTPDTCTVIGMRVILLAAEV